MSSPDRHSVAATLAILAFCVLPRLTSAQPQGATPRLSYEVIADFFQLPPGEHFVEPAGVAVNSKGTSMSSTGGNIR